MLLKAVVVCWQTTVLDGRTGEPLVEPYLRSTIGSQLSPLTVAMEGEGNDLFLHWLDDCEGHEGEGTPFTFLEGKLYCHMPSLNCTSMHLYYHYCIYTYYSSSVLMKWVVCQRTWFWENTDDFRWFWLFVTKVYFDIFSVDWQCLFLIYIIILYML